MGLLCVTVLSPTIYAQKGSLPKKILRSMRRKQAAEQLLNGEAAIPSEQTVALTQQVQHIAETASAQAQIRATGTAILRKSSVNAERTVFSLFQQNTPNSTRNPVSLLGKLWERQTHFEQPLFPLFIRRYYTQQFGEVSSHMDAFFTQLGSIQDKNIELRITKRIHYLAQNKRSIGEAILAQKARNPFEERSFRVRYLNNTTALTAENFNEKKLVLSIERRMSPNPYHDLPILHVNGRSSIEIDQQIYPLFFYNGPFDNLNRLYYFLLNGSQPSQKVSFVLDENAQSIMMFNRDRTLWLRISSHEFMNPQNLHIHLNQLRPVYFLNQDGIKSTELINLNLSIPLVAPPDTPRAKPGNFLYKRMISAPIRRLAQDVNATIEKRTIW